MDLMKLTKDGKINGWSFGPMKEVGSHGCHTVFIFGDQRTRSLRLAKTWAVSNACEIKGVKPRVSLSQKHLNLNYNDKVKVAVDMTRKVHASVTHGNTKIMVPVRKLHAKISEFI